VAGRRVFAARALDQPAGDRGRTRLGRAPFERLDVSEAECFHRREVETADRDSDIPKRVGALVPELGGVRQRSRTHSIENDHAGAGHAAILVLWKPRSDLSASQSSSFA